jgi:Cu(I)/Ag(I) efflux system membrane protein CusA/SilA
MVARLIRWAIAERGLVLGISLALGVAGLWAARSTPVDAIPDLSDVQVIVRTSWPGQAPQVVEDQVTYPLATALLAVPRSTTVRAFSLFGDSYVYVLFEGGTDPYWARSRVLEYLSQVSGRLPPGVRPALGPDASGVGWVYQYALVDRSGAHDLAELRALQDWLLRFELQSVPGVAEVASVGGMVKQYQVVVHPDRLRAFGVTLDEVRRAIERGGGETGGSVVEMAEAEYMVRARGYVQGVEDLRALPVARGAGGVPVTLRDLAEVRVGPQVRRGIAELDGQGEVTGGIVVARHGANAREVIRAVEQRLAALAPSLPAGVEVVEVYDRSGLIERVVGNLERKLVEEFVVVALVCALFLAHLGSSLVVVLSLPLGILAALLVMQGQGLTANAMSLGGIAIAVGTMVDAGVVMIENAHKHLERAGDAARDRWRVIAEAACEIGPSLFFSSVVVAVSFLPVFTLEAQEGRLFAPLAWTKTWAMAAAALLSVTLVPVLMGYLIRGRIRPEHDNPLNRAVLRAYRPVVELALARPRAVLLVAAAAVAVSAWPLSRLGTEFMPELDEGDLLYMPTTLPGVSIGEAQQLLQQTDRLIRTVPEVARVFGKVGSAETATDPAPLSMIETVVQLKPRDQWRSGVDLEQVKAELDAAVRLPGLTNAWVPPIKARIDMLATGIKTPVGIKVAGPDLGTIQRIATEVERAVRALPGTRSVIAERVAAGRYLDVEVRRRDAARYGLAVADVQEVIATAVGGMDVAWAYQGRERYPVNLRYPQAVRDSLGDLEQLPIVTPDGARIPLGAVATVRIADGPAEIKSEDARPSAWVYVDIAGRSAGGRDLGSFVAEAKARVAAEVALPPGYSIAWSGQYQYLERAAARLSLVAPATLLVIVLLLRLGLPQWRDVVVVMAALPFALVGGVWLLWALSYDLSVAVGVGFIALAGVAAETGVVMLVYLHHAWDARLAASRAAGRAPTDDDLRAAVEEGALLRVRPKLMTVTCIIAGLLPIMWGSGAGSEVMRRIAAPMVGGMASATLLTLVVVPAAFLLWARRDLARGRGAPSA